MSRLVKQLRDSLDKGKADSNQTGVYAGPHNGPREPRTVANGPWLQLMGSWLSSLFGHGPVSPMVELLPDWLNVGS